MREKCQEELIESMRVKQERTDSQLKNFREVRTQVCRQFSFIIDANQKYLIESIRQGEQ